MSAGHVLKYHLAVPAAIFGVLALVGVPLGTAFVIGMMSGCLSMMLMMGGMSGHRRHEGDRELEERSGPR
jgi:hypothetical protein